MNNQIAAETLSPITHNSIPVITTELLAQLYGTEPVRIRQGYSRNIDRFVEGKHFFKLVGTQLKAFKNEVSLNDFVKISPTTNHLILWTERGAARHAKMLETDQAWEVFEQLEDCYFSQREQVVKPAPQPGFEAKYPIYLTAREFCDLAWIWKAARHMYEEQVAMRPALEMLKSPYADFPRLIEESYGRMIRSGGDVISRESMCFPAMLLLTIPNWSIVLRDLKVY